MSIIETLTMAEIDEIAALSGRDFSEIMDSGIKPGREMASLAWVLEKRTNPGASIDKFRAMNMAEMAEFLKGFTSDPKEANTLS
jgi:hypothetical protein